VGGVVVRVLASHFCGPRFDPQTVSCELSLLLLVLFLASRDFSLVFLPQQKPTLFQFDLRMQVSTLLKCNMYVGKEMNLLIYYLFIGSNEFQAPI
jgi:hypothetical protein